MSQTPAAESGDDAAVEAEWDAEIDARVKEVEESKVELVCADEAIARVRARLAARQTPDARHLVIEK